MYLVEHMRVMATALAENVTAIFARLRDITSDTDGDEPSEQSADFADAKVVQPLGIFARPVKASKTVGAFCLRIGDKLLPFLMHDERTSLTITIEDGELCVYCPQRPTSRVLFKQSGGIDIKTDAGDPQDITLNGGTLKVARDTDPVALGTFAFTPGTGGASLAWTPPGGGAPVPITPVGAALTGNISDGADNVKA